MTRASDILNAVIIAAACTLLAWVFWQAGVRAWTEDVIWTELMEKMQ